MARSSAALALLFLYAPCVLAGGLGGYSNWTNATDWSWCVGP